MTRRQYGSGGLRQRADGKWVGTIEAGYTPRGTRRRVSVVATTKAEAKRKLTAKQRALDTDGAAPTSGRATVKTWSDVWLPIHAAKVRPSTYTTDAGAVRKWIVPTIGAKRLDTLTPGDVRAVHVAIRKAGKSSTTARQAHWVLMGMLKAALLEGHRVPPNVLLVQAPVKAAHDRDAIPLEDVKAILAEAAKGNGARWVMALLQGMRQAEVLGLTWDAIDLERGVVDVSWQLQPLPYLDRAAGTFRVPDGYEARHLVHAYHLTRPKTSSGQRIIPLVPWTVAALRRWREDGWTDNPWGLLWTDLDTRYGRAEVRPLRASVDRAAWADLQARAGVAHASGRPYVLHEARHAAASLLLELGVDPKVVEAIMGHSSILTTRGYQHVSQELSRRAMEDMAARIGLQIEG